MSGKTALIAGASGLVGGNVLELLIADSAFDKVKVIVRKSLAIKSEKISEISLNFDDLQHQEKLFSADVVFCCLGTTIKKAGSQAAFKKVDFTYCLELAKAAKLNGAKHFILVSSIGADSKSSNFYLKTKGEIENAIAELGFESYSILRPSMLLGDRKENRLGETIGKILMTATSFLLAGSLKKYKAIEAATVARCMVSLSKSEKSGKMIFESDLIAKY